MLAAYGLFYARNRRAAFVAVGILTIIVARPWQPSATVIAIGVFRTAVGPLLALYFTARRRLVQALTERAERAEREQHLLAEQARTEERTRLAGEMHDVVTHRVSLMVLQAGALRMTAPDEATRQAAENLRVAGVQALDELRDLVGILRTEPEGDEAPSAADFAALVAEFDGGGHPGRADRGRRPGARLAGGRPHRVPGRPGGADQRAQARTGRRGDRSGQLRRRAGTAQHPQRPAAG